MPTIQLCGIDNRAQRR